FQAEDGIRDFHVTGVQTCALPIFVRRCLPKYSLCGLPPRRGVRSRLRKVDGLLIFHGFGISGRILPSRFLCRAIFSLFGLLVWCVLHRVRRLSQYVAIVVWGDDTELRPYSEGQSKRGRVGRYRL